MKNETNALNDGALSALLQDGVLRVAVGQDSRAGGKPDNDDRIGMFVPSDPAALVLKGAAFIVCDGVSAAEAGADAADSCVRGFLSDYFSMPDSWSVETAAQHVLTSLNRFLHFKGRDYADPQRGHLCTLSAMVIKSRTAHLFHIGDSRVYRVRSGELEQLTQDHRLQISDTKSYLSRAMGLDVKVEIDYRRVAVEPGDVFVMTTDGVHTFLDEAALIAGSRAADLEREASRLVELAIERGSDDNVSCQLVRVLALPSPDQSDLHAALSALPFPPLLGPGSVIDGYRVLERIHESPRSQLYAVVDIETDQRLAMKTPSVNFEDDEAYIERFVMEPWIGSRVQSTYVIASVVPARRPSYLYHLQEYAVGVTLEQWMRTYPTRDVAKVIRIVEQIARGLTALHRREIIHRDLKPDNVMIGPDGQVKILDLGAAWVAGVDELAHPHWNDVTPVGTASYGAPELRFGATPRANADLYSLGVLTYELLTGHLPYDDAIQRARSEADLVRLRYVPAYQHNPLVPIWMNGALRKAVRAQATLRYAELSEFVHDLSRPNPVFVNEQALPLLERNPLRFWRFTSLALLLLLAASGFYCLELQARLDRSTRSASERTTTPGAPQSR